MHQDFVVLSSCWIHTHPTYQLFSNGDNWWNVIWNCHIAPRLRGMKALCVRLTRQGKDYLSQLRQFALDHGLNERRHIIETVHENPNIKFYEQIPFQITDDDSTVVDFRGNDEVIGSLKNYIQSSTERAIQSAKSQKKIRSIFSKGFIPSTVWKITDASLT